VSVPRKRRLALLVAGCFFMEMLDGTIVATAAPAIGRSLAVPSSSISLVISTYLVTLAVLIPASGWAAARWGARPVFLAAIAIFTVASAGCAASTSLVELVAMRVLQGVGGALMVPVGRQVVLAETPKDELLQMISFLVWPALVAPVFAPLLGGALADYAGWHWIFLVNLPFGAAAFLVALRLIESPPVRRPPPLDRLGVLLTAVGLGGLTYAADLVSQPAPRWGLLAVVAVVAVICLSAAVRHLLRVEEPLLNLRTLRLGSLGTAIGGGSIWWLVIGAAPFLLPLFLEEACGWSPVKSGAFVVLLFVGNIAIKPAVNLLYGRFGFRAMLLVASLGFAASMVALSLVDATTWPVLIGLFACGSGVARSIGSTGYMSLAFSEIPESRMGDANILQVTTQQLFIGLGAALGAVALRIGAAIDPDVAHSFSIAFLVVAVVALVGATGTLRLDRGAGGALRRRYRAQEG
jgi:EmrB/QacA subfamily drug resistance transporter